MAVTVAASWGAAQVVPASGSQPPRNLSLAVPVATTAGDWLVAVVSWRTTGGGSAVSVTVEDDAHNWWEPLSAPSTDSSSGERIRTAIWAAPAARAAAWVMVAPTGLVEGVAATILDVSGMLPWMTLAGYTTAALASATSLPMSLTAPSAEVLAVTACGTNDYSYTVTGPGTGWTSLAQQAATNGAGAHLVLNCAWQVTTAAISATWTASAAEVMTGATGALLVAATAPVQPNPDWPLVVTEIAPGAGASTPPSQLTWADVSSRDLGFGVTQGAPYLLGGLQAGQGTLTLDNVDGALIPPGTGAFAGIDSGTPARIRAVLPSQASPWYVFWSGTLQQLPQSWDAMERGMCDATVTDAYAYTTRNVPGCYRAEVAADSPYAWWPLSDASGSMYGGNIAPGNQNPMAVTLSKYGTGGASQSFGNTGGLKGDPGATAWAQTGLTNASVQSGYTLVCADHGFPALTGGVTVAGWFSGSGGDSMQNLIVGVNAAKGLVFQIYGTAPGTSGLQVVFYETSGNQQSPYAGSVNYNSAGWFHVMLTMSVSGTTLAYTFYVDGALVSSGSLTGSWHTRFGLLELAGQDDQFAAEYQCDVAVQHAEVFPSVLAAERAAAHYQAGSTAFAGESASWRMERLLGYAGTLGRRLILPETGVDVTPMASLSTLASSTTATATAGGYATSSGTPAATALQYVASATPPGWLTVSPTGAIVYVPKQYAWNQTPKWLLGEDTAAGENPYQGDISFGYDPARVINDIQLTQPDTGVITVPSLGALEASSQAKYGDQNMQVNAYLENDPTSAYAAGPGLGDLANWLAATNAAPALRLGTVTVDAASHPASWPLVLGAAPGDLVTVYRRPPTSDVVLTVIGRISQVQRTLSFDPEGTVAGSVQLSIDAAPEHLTLTCDDSVRGQLSGSNVLGW